ncbi:RNase H domain-containing protein [Trichonephila clavipes]|nr:RNase H domain-containing protein [Trichonephila clavipes]
MRIIVDTPRNFESWSCAPSSLQTFTRWQWADSKSLACIRLMAAGTNTLVLVVVFALSQNFGIIAISHKKLITVTFKSQNYSSLTKLRNSDGCSVFRSELIAIDTGLKEALSIPGSNSNWILSDSRSAIHHLSKWHKVADNKGVAILEKLKRLSSSREINLSTMGSFAQPYPTYINNKQSTVPPAHHWYEAKRPDGSLSLQCGRQEQAILTSFWSGHLRTLTFRDKIKFLPTCVGCCACQAEHLTQNRRAEGPMHVKYVEAPNGAVWKYDVNHSRQLMCRPRHLIEFQKYDISRKLSSRSLIVRRNT